ncbi:MAG: hypothetical protein H6765_03400 [Candidatus Peribacteria bacterium]|nr:MAG: hypothetical protein H6765_03400 [Candidatus Peribacteria bacterium]
MVTNTATIVSSPDVTDPDDPYKVGSGNNGDTVSFYYSAYAAQADLAMSKYISFLNTGSSNPYVVYTLVVGNS